MTQTLVANRQIKQIILASSSPFRQAILKQAGIPFVAVKAAVDEYNYHGDHPKEVALARARAKAAVVAQDQPASPADRDHLDHLVLGCDQVLEFAGLCLDKVHSELEAYERLQLLSGQQHFLHSAVVLLVRKDAQTCYVSEFCTTVALTMHQLSPDEIKAYLAKAEWQGSVACYQFENHGAQLFSQVQGDTTSIVGLPIVPLVTTLRKLGINFLKRPQAPWDLQLEYFQTKSWADIL